MERIQSFVRDFASKPVPPENDLEHEVVHSEKAIPHKSIQDYADFIVEELNKQKSNIDYEGRAKIVLEALRDEQILENFLSVDKNILGEIKRADFRELKAAITRVRLALIEEIKKKIDGNLYLYIEDYLRVIKKKEDGENRLVGSIVDVQTGQEQVYKNKEGWNEDDQFKEAVDIFRKLPPHPNIRNFVAYDPENGKVILEKRDFVSFSDYLLREKLDLDNFLEVLKCLKDCIAAAQFLSDNELVLQDIKLSNLGIEKKDGKKQGLLFDPEGLTKKGVEPIFRLWHEDNDIYFKFLVDYAPPYYGKKISPLEMIYQFGECLGSLLDKIDINSLNSQLPLRKRSVNWLTGRSIPGAYDDLEELSDRMMALSHGGIDADQQKETRINFDKVLIELDKVITKLEQSSV